MSFNNKHCGNDTFAANESINIDNTKLFLNLGFLKHFFQYIFIINFFLLTKI